MGHSVMEEWKIPLRFASYAKHERGVKKVELGPAVVPNERNYGAASMRNAAFLDLRLSIAEC